MPVEDQGEANVTNASFHLHDSATERARPPFPKRERPPTPDNTLRGPTSTSEHREAIVPLMPTQILEMGLSGNLTASTSREPMLTGNHHTANVEETSHRLPSTSEHGDHASTQALAVSTHMSEQGMSDNNVEPTQMPDRAIAGSSSSNALHCSSSPIENNKADLGTVSSHATRPIPQQKDDPGLTKEEIIAMLAGYRGGENGLADRSRSSLLGLLKFYEVSAVL